ncbi:MAG TPA: ABC transporter substrate-binding protein [Candidatus Limnocylindrales bacterium]|jgi:NitT/TauT family transport system substrate-binding protein
MRRLLFAVAVIALVGAACSGITASPSSGSSVSPPTSAPASAPPSAAASPSAGPSAAAKPDVVNFSLNWFPLADHAAYYAALASGDYEKQNLAVNILQGSGSGASVRRVDIGQADCGIADTPVIVNGIRNGAQIKIVAMEFDHSPDAIWTTKKTGITKPADLVGKTVGAAADDSERILFPALAAANGIDPNSVKFVDIQGGAYYAALAANRVDAIFDFTTGAPFVEAAVGKGNAVSIPWSSNGLDLYGLAIFCNNDTLTNRPDVVKRFLDVSLTGWQSAMTDTQKALEAEQQYVPQLDVPTYTSNFKLAVELMCTKNYQDNGIGHIDAAKMKNTVDVIQKFMTATGSISDPAAIYTNDFLGTKHDLPACSPLT